jgi:hypothetical protein
MSKLQSAQLSVSTFCCRSLVVSFDSADHCARRLSEEYESEPGSSPTFLLLIQRVDVSVSCLLTLQYFLLY